MIGEYGELTMNSSGAQGTSIESNATRQKNEITMGEWDRTVSTMRKLGIKMSDEKWQK